MSCSKPIHLLVSTFPHEVPNGYPNFLACSVLILSPPFSSSTNNILKKGSSLVVPNGILISPNGLFSTGFYPVGNNAYCFAIWFSKPFCQYQYNCTIVWMANRDQPVNGKHSKLSLLKHGNLTLTDAGKFIVWSSNTISGSTVQLELYNTGNLVLHIVNGSTLWQSFDSPTDTLVPQQPLTRYTQLVSSRSKDSYSSGYYKLLFDYNNVLRLIFDGHEISSIYWPDAWLLDDQSNRSRYNDTRNAVFDSFGYFISSDGVVFSSADYGEGPQRRLTLDYDGNLRLYSLQEANGTWSVSWQAMNEPCKIHNTCGPNSICSYDPGSGRKCFCLTGFKMKNQIDWSYGCEPEFNLSCENRDVSFLKLPNLNFNGYSYKILRNYTLDMCKKACLDSCCKAFQYISYATEGFYNCYLKSELRNGHHSLNFNGTLFLKIPKSYVSLYKEAFKEFKLNCSDHSTKQLERTYRKKGGSGSLKILLWCAYVIGSIEISCIFLVFCFLYKTHQSSDPVTQGYLVAEAGFKRFTYAELRKATQGFKEVIGRGGGGVVYKGVLPDQRVAAIKRLNDANQGEEEFLAEASTIGRLNHMNLIEIWGYCAEGKHRLLVYEYMEHGSLAGNLWSNLLDWEKRFDIAVGTAKGLAYLHEECLEWVLHCDVKPQNILLDSNYKPKVADFGLSKLLNRVGVDNSNFTKLRGTRGYMAPEWVFNLPITSKVDVYSYGIVVLEMVTGRNPTMGVNAVEGSGEVEHQGLVTWVREKKNGAASMTSWVEEIIDPRIGGEYETNKLETLLEVALQCVKQDQDARPTMSQVVEMLLRHKIVV